MSAVTRDKNTPGLRRYAGVVFLVFWLIFACILFPIGEPNSIDAELFWLSTLLSGVTTLAYFSVRWAVGKHLRKNGGHSKRETRQERK